jgi:hypothetical protein
MIAHFSSCLVLLVCIAIPACAPHDGIVTERHKEVTGRPVFSQTDSGATMKIMEGSRPTDQSIEWSDVVLNHRQVDTSRHYRFELLEGSAVSREGEKFKRTEVWRMHDDQNLLYDASICRVHSTTMQRTQRQDGVDTIRLPRDFDSLRLKKFPNSIFDHPACSSIPAYSIPDWTCRQCSEFESKWLKKNLTPTN